jgi:hypothetical protein
MDSATIIVNNFLPVLTMTITFAFYTLVQKRELTASKGESLDAKDLAYRKCSRV